MRGEGIEEEGDLVCIIALNSELESFLEVGNVLTPLMWLMECVY